MLLNIEQQDQIILVQTVILNFRESFLLFRLSTASQIMSYAEERM